MKMGIKIDCISDCHGFLPDDLSGGDILIVGGDLTARDQLHEYQEFCVWLHNQDYRCKIVIAGNHDNDLQKEPFIFEGAITNAFYLCDSGTEFEGFKIWGSPWTKTFEGINPQCKAFTVDTEEELSKKWELIPKDTDILITHSPAYGILDGIEVLYDGTMFYAGSHTLRNKLEEIKPKLFVCGHIHEGYGKLLLKHEGPNTWCVNSSRVNRRYRPVNAPMRIEL